MKPAQICLEKTFGLTLLPRKDIQCILIGVIYGMIWDHFWIFWFSPFQVNWSQRRPRGWKVEMRDSFSLKYQLFIRFNFIFMYYGQFRHKSSLKLRFVLFKPERVTTGRGFEIPAALDTFSGLKMTNINFKPLLGGNWPLTIHKKNWI